jgi:hypothetical protein
MTLTHVDAVHAEGLDARVVPRPTDVDQPLGREGDAFSVCRGRPMHGDAAIQRPAAMSAEIALEHTVRTRSTRSDAARKLTP